ncbi:MAG: glycosyltransferase [Lachnospiraceae bacterium]|nr:glycosyltransferase [Lachnospiraceae bacterium]
MGKVLKVSNVRKTINYLKKNGLKNAYYAARERIEQSKTDHYSYVPVPEDVLEKQRKELKDFDCKFSILVPAYETKEEYLHRLLQSVLGQSYEKFELIIADASSSDCVEKVIRTYEDNRIKYKRLKNNGGISANTNQALMYATGDYAALLDHDDVLTPDALYEMASCIKKAREENIELQMLYSDEDKCNGDETTYYEVNRKPKFNLDLILSNNYICHLLVMKRQLMQELQFRTICDGAQDYDLVLRAVSYMLGKEMHPVKASKLPIAHIPKVLYHWRCHEASTAENPESKRYAYDAGKRALEDFMRSRQWKGKVSHLKHLGFYRIEYAPDLLTNRSDVAVVGGKLIDRKNKITGGIYGASGDVLYAGLHKEYSGYLHRAVLCQEAEAIDIRCMKASDKAGEVMEEILGLPYLENKRDGRFNWQDCLKEDTDYKELSLRFCAKIRERGMRIIWDPEMIQKID